MENCLVKKYKSEVNNNALNVLGKFKITRTVADASNWGSQLVQVNTTGSLRITSDDFSSIKINGNVTNLPTNISGSRDISFGPGVGSIFLEKYIPGHFRLSFPHTQYTNDVGTLYEFLVGKDKASFTELNLTGCKLHDDTEALRGMTSLKTLRLNGNPDLTDSLSAISSDTSIETIDLSNTGIHGNITDFGKLTSLSFISFSNYITGELEDFIDAQISNGRSSVDSEHYITFNSWQGKVRFNGQNKDWNAHLFVTWESANRFIAYCGASITNYTRVVAKGATQEEIAAWTAAGKIIVHWDDAN